MTDETTRLRDALEPEPNPNRKGDVRWALVNLAGWHEGSADAAIASIEEAAAAEARAGLVSVEDMDRTAHLLHARVSGCDGSDDPAGCEACHLEAAALAATPPAPAVRFDDFGVRVAQEPDITADPLPPARARRVSATPPAPAVEPCADGACMWAPAGPHVHAPDGSVYGEIVIAPTPERLLAAIEAQAIGEVEA